MSQHDYAVLLAQLYGDSVTFERPVTFAQLTRILTQQHEIETDKNRQLMLQSTAPSASSTSPRNSAT